MSQRKYVGYVSADAVTSREGFELAVARLRHLPGSVAEVLCDLDRVDVLCALIANQNLGEEFRVRAGEILVRKFGPSATKGKGKVWLAIAEGLMGIIRAKGAFPGCVREWLSELPADWPHVQDLLAMDAGWSVEDVEAEWSRLSIEPEPCRQVMQLIGNPSTPAHVLRDIYATYPSDVVVAQWLARAPGCPDDLRWQLMVEHKKSVGWLVWKHGTPPPRAASLLNHTLSGHKDHIKKLSDLYGPEDVVEHVVETQSLFALLEIYGEPAVPVAAGHPDPGMRLRLARFHHRRGVNHDWNHFLLMAHLACDPEVKVRAAAVQQLPPCLLERFIRDPEPAVRVAAVRNPSASPEVLIAASQDPSDAVRDAAATATVKALAS